jgi:hypothetical protein
MPFAVNILANTNYINFIYETYISDYILYFCILYLVTKF